ncbi:MAG: hypothetical protein ABEN55_15780 [Bradymonadaceae bacterium]
MKNPVTNVLKLLWNISTTATFDLITHIPHRITQRMWNMIFPVGQ